MNCQNWVTTLTDNMVVLATSCHRGSPGPNIFSLVALKLAYKSDGGEGSQGYADCSQLKSRVRGKHITG